MATPYNLPMQISLQAPLKGDITAVKSAIEKGLQGINVGSAIKASITKPIKLPIEIYVGNKTIKDMKDAIKAKLSSGVSVDLTMSSKSISDQKKKVQAAFANLKIGIAVTKKDVSDAKKVMAKKFTGIPITVKVTKKNISDIRKSIEAGLQNLTISINPNINQGNINQQTKSVSKTLKSATGDANSFFDSIQGKARSFAAYAVASTAILKLSGAVANATNEAIKYEKELINISQTTGDSIERTKLFSDALVEISKKYNINVSQVAKLTRILAQTGMTFREATQGAEVLARTSLLSGFDDLTSTTEGLVAIMQTFNMTVNSASGVLESINAVSKAYAVESTDLVESIKRTGGAFSVAGGTVEELIALITAVRSTTRESAETISTGFRTIFGRLQRPKTIEYFKNLGIVLEDAEGKFVGPFEAIKRINEGLARLNITVGDVRFSEVVEQIGGIRQISKVVPLLTQAGKAQEVLNIANNASADSIEDLEKAQKGLGYRLGTLQKEFAALISEVVNSSSFKFLADVFINLSKSVISTVRAFKPLLPILSTVATFAAGRVAGQVLAGNTTLKKSFGFASGGYVPGSGNGDTVPAMLTPGEFVVNKKSAQAFGYGNLESVNKYAKGGIVNGVQRFAEGGSVKRSWSEFFGLKKAKVDPMQEDVKRGGGDVINTFDDLKKAVESVTADMGDLGEQILKQVKFSVQVVADSKGRLREGVFKPNTGEVRITPRGGKTSTVAHEIGHTSDYLMGGSKLGTEGLPLPGKVGAERFASGQKGTLQNKLAKIAQQKMYTELRAQGVAEEDLRYRLNLQEIYADLFEKSGPAVRAILSSTTSARKGIQELAHLLENEPEVYNRLFMGIDAEIPALVKARKRGVQAIQDAAIGAEIEKEKQLEAAKQAELAAEAEKQNRIEAEKQAAIAAEIERDRQRTLQAERSSNVKTLRSEGTITGKKAKKGLQTEESKAIGLEIRQENEKIKGLSKAKEEAQARSEQLPKNLSSLKAGVQTGVISQANYNQAAKQIKAQIKQEQELVNALEEQIQTSKSNAAQLQTQYKASQQKSQSLLYSPANPAPTFPKGNGPGGGGGGGGGMPPIGPVAQFSKAIAATNDQLKKMNLTFVELAVYAQGTASVMSQFLNMNINQAALSAGTAKGGVLSTIGDAIGSRGSEDNIKRAGASLRAFSKQLPDSVGKPLRSAGNLIFKNSAVISKNILKVAKGFDILSKVELFGGFLDSIFSVDYAGQRDKYIQLGDATSAAQAAVQAYAQEQTRAIPLIGGFLSALGANSSATEDSLDATGKLAVANARLAATINGSDKAFKTATTELSQARLSGDKEGEKAAIGKQLDVIDNLNKMSADVASKQGAAGISGKSIAMGYAGGAVSGAAIGSIVPVIGTTAGAAAGALIGGVMAWRKSANTSKEEIAKGYALMSDSIKKGSELQTALIQDLGKSLASESNKMLLAGGTAEEAFAKTVEKLGGKEQLTRMLGGMELSGDIKKDAKGLKEESEIRGESIETLKRQKAAIKDSDKVAIEAKEAEINLAQAQKDKVDSILNELVQTDYQNQQTKKLIERRKIEAAAIEYQIQMMKQLETAFDAFNASSREFSNISEEMANVGTGRLSTRQAASRVGVDDMRMFEMDAKEIMRNPDVAEKVAAYASSAGAPGQEINKASLRVRQLSQFAEFAKSGKVSELSKSTTEDASTDAKKDLQQKIFDELGFDENDPILKEAVAKMADTVISEGVTATGKALEEGKDIITKLSEDIISKYQDKLKELFQAEQKYREAQIDLINKQTEDAKKVYESEKAYFDQRLSLNQKVSEALQTEPVGPKRAGFLGQKALATRNSQIGALSSRTGGANISQSISANVNRINVLRNDKGNDNEVEMATLRGNLELLSQAVRDQIDIEDQYLDGLIGMAKAQQEYTQSLYDAQGSIVRDLVTGTDQEVGQQLTTLNAAAIASQQGSFAGIPETLKKDIFSLFDQFADIEIPGLGKTGRDAQREITKNEMMKRFGVDAATAEQLASKAVNDKVPIDQKMAVQIENQRQIVEKLMYDEYNLKESQILREIDNTVQFGKHVASLGITLNQMITDLGMSRIPVDGRPVNAPTAQIPNKERDANNKPIQIETNGQQVVTVNLPNLQSMTNNAITAMVYEQVSQVFKGLSQEVRTANNFEDVSNALANAATKTQTVEMGTV